MYLDYFKYIEKETNEQPKRRVLKERKMNIYMHDEQPNEPPFFGWPTRCCSEADENSVSRARIWKKLNQIKNPVIVL